MTNKVGGPAPRVHTPFRPEESTQSKGVLGGQAPSVHHGDPTGNEAGIDQMETSLGKGFGRTAERPQAAAAALPPSAATNALGVQFQSKTDLRLKCESLLASFSGDVRPFPAVVHEGLVKALQTSTSRIVRAHENDKVTNQEAAEALEMMREMMEALGDIHSGQAVVTKREKTDHVQVWNVVAPDGDAFVVTARQLRDDRGDPRISFRHMKDDGVALPGRHRMGVRIDLEKWGQASVDVQFGGSSLDKRIHGLMKNEAGEIFTTETGKKLADHHFRDDLPEEIREPHAFAAMVQEFMDGKISLLPDAASTQPHGNDQ